MCKQFSRGVHLLICLGLQHVSPNLRETVLQIKSRVTVSAVRNGVNEDPKCCFSTVSPEIRKPGGYVALEVQIAGFSEVPVVPPELSALEPNTVGGQNR